VDNSSMPEKRQLLPEQAAAAHEINKHISVTAGPGSGKTTVLVERYLHILRQHKLNIDQIVAITFTNRAANEMRERLRDELSEILKTATPEERTRWLGYKRTLDGAVITTIHGFCARLLREFPVEARVDPQFLLLDEHRAAMLLESIVEEVLSKFISNEHAEVSRLTLGVGRAKLAAALAQLYRQVRGQGLSLEELARTTASSHNAEDAYPKALRRLDDAVSQYFDRPKLSVRASEKRLKFKETWTSTREILETMPQHDTLAEYCSKIESLRQFRPDKTAIGDLSSTIDELLWGPVSKRVNDYSGLIPQICFDYFAQVYALEMVNLLTSIDARLTEEKQKLSALDFDDLEIRTLELLNNPAVLIRATERYRFFLVDEFQDTNALQRKLLERLAMQQGRNAANLFIVGDRKQSIYGFRGADVDVFREMTKALVSAGGEPKPLHMNFRSQPPLISFFNYLFKRLFRPSDDVPTMSDEELAKLGYVAHEPSEAQRAIEDIGPLVELLIATRPRTVEYRRPDRDFRELDAIQLANRIISLRQENPQLKYSDIALLFRAMTQVHFYESVFRRANIPYQTVLGRGFYEREEITDLIQLLRFLDNRTDEIALAAVLRSPLCGISDNALLALRSAPGLEETESTKPLSDTRPLYKALRQHRKIAFINDQEHDLLERASHLISRLVARRHHYSIEDLLRFAVEESEYLVVVAANFDGAQRLANVQRLFTLAARFEGSGNHLIRDFVRYVEEFEAIGSRESEGQIDEAANAVKLMTIHQAKGLEFPVVIIPELHRSRTPTEFSFMLDRHRGITLRVPDGRGKTVAGCTFSDFEKRHAWREQFESMRLLYVAATRAQNRLILSGATEELSKLSGSKDSWLKCIWQELELENRSLGGVINLDEEVQLSFTINVAPEPVTGSGSIAQTDGDEIGKADSLLNGFPLLKPLEPASTRGIHRFSVTQLINYQRCPRQYYFDRVLQLPSADELAVWNNAEAPEPPANLTATLKGAVIHRFCERYSKEQNAEECLRRSFDEVVRLRQAELADRLVEIDAEAALKELLPLANHYLESPVFSRVEQARTSAGVTNGSPSGNPGLWSELSFRLRRPLGVVSGAIDKLVVTKSIDGTTEVEIIDFKTNRLGNSRESKRHAAQVGSGQRLSVQPSPSQNVVTHRLRPSPSTQFSFDFDAGPALQVEVEDSLDQKLHSAAQDYQLQMQAYALAIRELVPALKTSKIRVTLHFLEPNLEFHLREELLETSACEAAIDAAMLDLVSSAEPVQFPVRPAAHCRMCNFLRVCAAGREFVSSSR
jgi:ATP-dependent helicase/nuclease subunit A